MEKPKCPYMESGICYRHGCIYRPSQNCMTENELRGRMKYVKRMKKYGRKRIKY